MSAGKGDAPRPVDGEAYRRNYDAIFRRGFTPITRAELACMVPPDGLIIELGVAAGYFAEEMLTKNPNARYVGIDKWDDHHDEDEMMRAIDRLRRFRNVATVRDTFDCQVDMCPDNHADLIYIDGYAHTGQERGQTLRDWWPKLKPGGIFAGHDYDEKAYPQTVRAVDDFLREVGLCVTTNLHIINEKPHPSWWVRKPD